MKNTKKVALYSPYLDILGGGERHILSILKVFDELGYEIMLIWDDPAIIKKIAEKLSIVFKHITVIPNFLRNKNPLATINNTKKFEFLFYVTDGSYFFSAARHTYIFAMVPDKKLYRHHLLNQLKTMRVNFICNSQFTQKWLKKWGIQATVVYPFINNSYYIQTGQISNKDEIILSVGRFFPHLHSKKHKEIIETFKKYKQKSSNNLFKLYLVGGVNASDRSYFDEIKGLASKNKDIIVEANISESDLELLYKRARYYWHFTGFGIDENAHPEKVEHLGVAPLEAMAAGCIVICYNAGGPKEIIVDAETGYLFSTEQELLNKMNTIESNKRDQIRIAQNGVDFVKTHFSNEFFRKRVIEYFKLPL